MSDPLFERRRLMDLGRRLMIGPGEPRRDPAPRSGQAQYEADDAPPRLTLQALEKIRMSRSRDRILADLDTMYREAFERAKASGDEGQMTSLDFAYRREQLYFEILLDVRDGMERR